MLSLLVPVVLSQAGTLSPVVSRLDNGLQVVVVPCPASPLVSVQLCYRVGSADDDIEHPGLCHVTRAILERRDARAGVESRTLRDACYFAWLVPAGQIESVLGAEARRMSPRPAAASEIGAAVRATAGDLGFAHGRNEIDVLGALFADDPYQRPPGLVAASLTAVTPEEVNEFLGRWFVPGNATLVVVGDVQPPPVQELVREQFGGLPWREPPHREWQRPPGAEQIHLSAATANYAGLDVAWLTQGLSAGENLALDVLLQRLCNPVDGLLCRRLVDVGCPPPRWHRETWRRAGAVVLSVNAPPADSEPAAAATDLTKSRAHEFAAAEIEHVIREALEHAADTPASEIELNRARALAAREVHNRRLTFAARALELGLCEVVGGDLLLAQWELPRIERCTVGDLRRAAAELRAARTVWRPRTPGSAGAARASDTQPRTADAHTALPCPSGEAPEPLNDVVKLTIYVDPAAEVVEVRTLVGTGIELGEALRALMAVGSTEHSLEQIRDYLSYHGLDLFPLDAESECGLLSCGPAERVPQMIELQEELIRHPNRAAATCQAAAENGRRLVGWLRAGLGGEARQLYLPPGFIGWNVPDTPGTDAAALRAALEQLDKLRNVEIVVRGAVDPAVIRDAVKLVWDDWQPAARSP